MQKVPIMCAKADLSQINNSYAVNFNNEPFKCPMCSKNFGGDGIVLRDCLHIFCLKCLNDFINQKKGTVIKCLYSEIAGSSTGVVCSSVLQVTIIIVVK
jgi:hypothetical protein